MAKDKILKYLIFALFIIFPLGQLSKIPLAITNINIYLHDLIIISFVSVFFIKQITEKKKILTSGLSRKVIIFIAIASFSLLINLFRWGIGDSLLGLLYLVRWVAYFLFYLSLKNLFLSDINLKSTIKKLMICSALIAVFLGIIQYFLYPNLLFLKYFNWDPHYYRLTSTWLDSGFSGMLYLLFLILSYEFYRKNKFSIKKIIIPASIYLSLALTYSRSSYLALLTTSLVYSLKEKTIKYFLAVSIILIVTIGILPRHDTISTQLERGDTVYSRVENWKNSIKVASISPIIGIGFNNYRQAINKLIPNDKIAPESHSGSGADSSLLFVLVTTGILGLILYLSFVFKSIIGKKSILLVASTVALLTHSIFNNSLFYGWIMIWWWTLLALEE